MEQRINKSLAYAAYGFAALGIGIALVMGGVHNFLLGALAAAVGRAIQTAE